MSVEDSPVAIVTGARGGVGSAVVQQLLEAGYRVIAEDIAPADGRPDDARVRALVADVARPESAERAVAAARTHFGRLDLLVNNAARFIRKPIADCTVEDWDELMNVNVRGAFLRCQRAVPDLARAGGSIVNVGSISGLVGIAGQSIYSATKGALIQLTRQLAIEFAPLGVRVNAVAPGAIDTGFALESRRGDPDPDASAAAVRAAHPLGRISTAGEVASAIVFLASSRAAGITGEILSVDGGYVAR